eukprot:1160423-Pelagomonas_calceolata.AAC.7
MPLAAFSFACILIHLQAQPHTTGSILNHSYSQARTIFNHSHPHQMPAHPHASGSIQAAHLSSCSLAGPAGRQLRMKLREPKLTNSGASAPCPPWHRPCTPAPGTCSKRAHTN